MMSPGRATQSQEIERSKGGGVTDTLVTEDTINVLLSEKRLLTIFALALLYEGLVLYVVVAGLAVEPSPVKDSRVYKRQSSSKELSRFTKYYL